TTVTAVAGSAVTSTTGVPGILSTPGLTVPDVTTPTLTVPPTPKTSVPCAPAPGATPVASVPDACGVAGQTTTP
ncbi:MAG TPA: hypothetical protein VE991_05540, partial [Acidimicrobiales bacterium]|nr:hypothetical protein [Acidimicrobiales bacterium]